MTMQFEGQYEDEEVLMFFRTHPIVLRRPLIAFLAILLLSVVPFYVRLFLIPPPPGIIIEPLFYWIIIGGLIVGSLVLFYFWIGWYFSLYIVTNVRVVQDIQKGLFGKQLVEIDLDKVQNVNYEVEGFQAALFKFGTIVIQTFVGDLVIENVHHPAEIQKELSGILRQYGGKVDAQEEDR